MSLSYFANLRALPLIALFATGACAKAIAKTQFLKPLPKKLKQTRLNVLPKAQKRRIPPPGIMSRKTITRQVSHKWTVLVQLWSPKRTLLHKSTIFLWNQCLKAFDCYAYMVMMVQVLALLVEARRMIMLSLWYGNMIQI